VFDLLEMLAVRDWLVSVWHPSKVYSGAREADMAPPDSQQLEEMVATRWTRDNASSAGDLGTLILYSLAMSYTNARRTLHSWLETWELEFFSAVGSDRELNSRALAELRGLIGEFAKRLRSMKLKREDEHKSWFAGLSSNRRAKEIDEMLSRALEDLSELNALIRSSFDLAQLHATQQQRQAAEQQRQAAEGVQRKLELITALLLVPTLIAGIFGANTSLPGEARWTGFGLMLVLMAVCAVAVLMWLRSIRTPYTRDQRGGEPASASESVD
jgi:hypothetical protein